ncbi:MAG: alpha/beta hydrolase [Bacteroidota bacterium]
MKKIKIILLAPIVLASAAGLGLVYYLFSNDAPITHGEIQFDIPYKEGQTLDIYFPTKAQTGKLPVVLFIHGGAWIGGRKEAVNFNRINGAFNQLRERGYMIISPNYTLARDGKSPFPDCIIDGFDAVRWITENAEEYKLDLDRFGVIGESAGGHIAMMTAFANPSDFGLEYPKVEFDFLIDIYGPNDLMELYHSETADSLDRFLQKLPECLYDKLDLPKLLFGFNPKEDSVKTASFTAKYSPITYLKADAPRTLMIHGDIDQIVPITQSINLQQRLDSLGVANTFKVLDSVNHAFSGAKPIQKQHIQEWIVSFIEEENDKL